MILWTTHIPTSANGHTFCRVQTYFNFIPNPVKIQMFPQITNDSRPFDATRAFSFHVTDLFTTCFHNLKKKAAPHFLQQLSTAEIRCKNWTQWDHETSRAGVLCCSARILTESSFTQPLFPAGELQHDQIYFTFLHFVIDLLSCQIYLDFYFRLSVSVCCFFLISVVPFCFGEDKITSEGWEEANH